MSSRTTCLVFCNTTTGAPCWGRRPRSVRSADAGAPPIPSRSCPRTGSGALTPASRPQSSCRCRGCRCGRPPTCQDGSRLPTRSLSIRCPACLARGDLAGRDGVRYARSKHMGDIGGCQCNLRKLARIDRPVLPSTVSCKFVGYSPSILARRQWSWIMWAWRLVAGCRCRPTPSSARRCGRTCWPVLQPPVSAAFSPEARRATA